MSAAGGPVALLHRHCGRSDHVPVRARVASGGAWSFTVATHNVQVSQCVGHCANKRAKRAGERTANIQTRARAEDAPPVPRKQEKPG